MNRVPVNMKMSQTKMELEPLKFTVPDITLMLESDDSLILKPGMTIPQRLCTPDQKYKNPDNFSYQQNVDKLPKGRSLDYRNVVDVEKHTSQQPVDVNYLHKRGKPENLIDLFKQNKECQNILEKGNFPPNHMRDIDSYMHSAPELRHEANDSRDRNMANMESKNHQRDNIFRHGLQQVNYYYDQQVQPVRKYYQENTDNYRTDRYVDSPNVVTDRQKYVRFSHSNSDNDHSILDEEYPVRSPSTPKSSTEEQHTLHLYQIIQNQNEQISHMQKVIEKLIDQKESDKMLSTRRPPSPIRETVSTQTNSGRISMRSFGINTDLTIDDVNSLIETKEMKRCVCKEKIVSDNTQMDQYKNNQSDQNLECGAELIFSEPQIVLNPSYKSLAVENDLADLTLYEEDGPKGENNECERQVEKRCGCCTPKGNSSINKLDGAAIEENGKTFYNFMINIQQKIQQYEGYGKDRRHDAMEYNNRIEDMKQQLMRYQNSYLDPTTMADIYKPRTPPEFLNKNRYEMNTESNRQHWHQPQLTDGQLAAIAAASSKERNQFGHQSSPYNQFREYKRSSSNNRGDNYRGQI